MATSDSWWWHNTLCRVVWCGVLCHFIILPVPVLCKYSLLMERVWNLKALACADISISCILLIFTLWITQWDFLFCVAVSECCIYTIIAAFLLLALPGAAVWLVKKIFHGCSNLLSKGILIPIPPYVSEFDDTIRFFKIIHECSSDS